jgi:cytoskeletal protein CcmA (bactofilin family)
MFSKQANKSKTPPARLETPVPLPPVEAAPVARPKPRAASLIADNITIEGNVVGEGEVQVDGVVRGDVRVGKLTVGDTGHIEGSVFAEAVEARGRIIGQVIAKQVRLYGTAYIDGDITHEQLAMETGAYFQGRSLKFQRAAQPPAAGGPQPGSIAAAAAAHPPAAPPPMAPAPQPKPVG